jgi:cell division protein FtsW
MNAAIWESRLLASVTAVLAVFGVAAVYGASSLVAVQGGDPGSAFALRQLGGVMVGGILLLVGARVPYQTWRSLAWPMMLASLVLLLFPFLPGLRALTPELNGARRWLNLGAVSFQPSEFAKFAVAAWTAMIAARKGEQIRDFKKGLLPVFVVVGPLCALVLFQPNLSTAVLTALIAGVILFTAGARIGHFLVLGLIAVPVLWRELTQVQYRFARMLAFISSDQATAATSWQIQQSLIGIGSGRFFGVGFGEGMQKLGYLPYAYSDFIFSTIGEEWGFLGASGVVALFALWMWMGFRIARTAPDQFGMLLVTGLTAMVGVTAILHIAVTLNLVPTTGLPLPFISYGRSNLLVSLFATGVMVNVARQRHAPGARR